MRDAYPVGVDATALAILAAIVTPFVGSPLRRQAERYPHLAAHVGRMMERCYPAYPWGLCQAAWLSKFEPNLRKGRAETPSDVVFRSMLRPAIIRRTNQGLAV